MCQYPGHGQSQLLFISNFFRNGFPSEKKLQHFVNLSTFLSPDFLQFTIFLVCQLHLINLTFHDMSSLALSLDRYKAYFLSRKRKKLTYISVILAFQVSIKIYFSSDLQLQNLVRQLVISMILIFVSYFYFLGICVASTGTQLNVGRVCSQGRKSNQKYPTYSRYW